MNAELKAKIDALANAQRRWDNMLPDDEPAFLETNIGQNWLSGAVDRLVLDGKDLHVNNRCRVLGGDYTDAVGKALEGIEIDREALGWLIAAVVAGDLTDATSAVHELIFDTGQTPLQLCESVAQELCEAIAEQAAEQIRRDNE